MKSRRFMYAAFLLVIVAGVAAALLAADRAGNHAGTRAGEIAGKRAAIALRESQLAGCERTKDDRLDAIRGWTAARIARLATAHNRQASVRDRITAGAAAETYRQVIAGYKSRIVDCATAFPPIVP